MKFKSKTKLNSFDNLDTIKNSGKFCTELDPLHTIMRSPFKGVRVQAVSPLKGVRVQAVNPLKGVRVQAVSPFKGVRVQAVNPLKGVRVQAVSPFKGVRVQAVSPLKGVRVQAINPLKRFHAQMGEFDKSCVNFIHTLNKGVNSIKTSIPDSLVGIDLFIEPEQASRVLAPTRIPSPTNSTHSFSKKVFVVCGNNKEIKQTVVRFIENLGLEAIIIDEQPSGAWTQIEMLEKVLDDIVFTVVLLTPDDVGKPKNKEGELNFRPSQDVILGLGASIIKYGRERICLLRKGELELPQFLNSINPIPIDTGGGWKLRLVQELASVEVFFDLHKIL